MSKETTLVPVITIDGPSGTGKGTLCHRLASYLGWHVLDSGAIYRALALDCLQQNIDFSQIAQVLERAHELPLYFKINDQDQQFAYLGEQEISQAIRSEQIGQQASRLARLPDVRAALLKRQRDFAKWPGLVTDGRDMGTVVFPEAVLKVFLTASAEVRAKRRSLQLASQGLSNEYQAILEELRIRDQRDMDRDHSPLTPATDAILIDTTGLSIVQVLDTIVQLTAERGIASV